MKQYRFFYPKGVVRIWEGALPHDTVPEEWQIDLIKVVEGEIPDPLPDPGIVWEEKLMGKIKDPITGISFLTRIQTRDLLSATMVLLNGAKERGMIQGSTPYSLWDADGTEYPLTVDTAIDVLLRYGLQWSQMYVEFAP